MPEQYFHEVAFYTNPVLYEAYTILSGKRKEEADFFLYFSVLKPQVWLTLGISLIIVTLVSVVSFLRISTSPSESRVTALSAYFWVYVAFMLRQVPNEKWTFLSSKRRSGLLFLIPLLTTLWAIGISFLVMTIFQSLLVSKLAIIPSKPVVNSVEEFVAKKNVIGRTPREIEIQEVLKGSGLPVYEETWIRLKPDLVDFDSVFTDESYAGLKDGSLCIFHGKLILKSVLSGYFRQQGECKFHISENEFFPFPLLMALSKNLPAEFIQKFNYGLTRLIDADLIGKWFKPIFQTSDLCTSYSDNTLKPLSLKNMYGVLVIWTVGIGTAFIVLIAEKMSHTKIKT